MQSMSVLPSGSRSPVVSLAASFASALWMTLLALFATLAAGCEPAHVQEYTPKERNFDRFNMQLEEEEGEPGSLWRESGTSNASLFSDMRAFRKGDVVQVKIQEEADAKRSADVGVDRESGMSALVSWIPGLGFLSDLGANGDYSGRVEGEGNSRSGFSSEGSTGRSERLVATVPAVVRRVLPNGNLIIEGERAVLVNDEEHHLYVSGIVRPIDIDQDNAVMSAMIAEAEIEFVGRGVITDNQKQGWFTRYFGWAWPF
jgi:flagellar L-ring protein precursor FlgH